jgi:hypothetical protein
MHVVNAAVLEDWNELSDEQVVADVLAGHTALFELLMRRHNERVYRAARAILRNEAEVEDVMQQSYHHDLTERTSSFAPDAFRLCRPNGNRVVARVLSRIAGA